ncbi:MAG: hypothetical protein R3250_06670 [Melioribacteraceae bacterium]|nr:hypothetical protein [Melioribacteraceae bacterium]
MKKFTRRKFLKNSALMAAGTLSFPSIINSEVIKKGFSPNSKINVGVIGCGRIARGHDIPLTLNQDISRVVAVCDVDLKRMEEGKKLVENLYYEKNRWSDCFARATCQRAFGGSRTGRG